MFTFESFYSRKIDSVISLPEIFLSTVDREAVAYPCCLPVRGRMINIGKALDGGGAWWPQDRRLSAAGAWGGKGPALCCVSRAGNESTGRDSMQKTKQQSYMDTIRGRGWKRYI